MDLKIDGLSLCGGGQRTDRHVGDMPSACATYQARRESAAQKPVAPVVMSETCLRHVPPTRRGINRQRWKNPKREVGLIEDLPRDEPKVIVL
jgi:hypothetical protein